MEEENEVPKAVLAKEYQAKQMNNWKVEEQPATRNSCL
jgi:hypothetical protein